MQINAKLTQQIINTLKAPVFNAGVFLRKANNSVKIYFVKDNTQRHCEQSEAICPTGAKPHVIGRNKTDIELVEM